MISAPEGKRLSIRERDPAQVAAEIRLNGNAVHGWRVTETDQRLDVVLADQALPPGREQNRDGLGILRRPVHESAKGLRIATQRLCGIVALRERAIAALVVAADQGPSIE